MSAWRSAPRNLDRILACRYQRVVGRDNIVTIPGYALQIPPGPHQRSYARARVEVRELLDGRLLVLRDDRILLEQPAPTTPFVLVPRDSAVARRRPRRPVALRVALNTTKAQKAAAPRSLPAGDKAALARNRRRPTVQHPYNRQSYKTPRQLNSRTGG